MFPHPLFVTLRIIMSAVCTLFLKSEQANFVFFPLFSVFSLFIFVAHSLMYVDFVFLLVSGVILGVIFALF